METNSVNSAYYCAIELAFQAGSHQALSLSVIIDSVADDIVDLYDGTGFAEYKREWHRSVLDYAKMKEIGLVSLIISWRFMY
ncbi:hypothetical protein MAM1_0315d09578 [Mucor ambiguus]|uniref:Uncharacterized protein n=1 Tax=Mucor ambiguus TaxID=91626 RepID=A0A0C9MRF3_9FUNG|nr:hypothetical protein MAM1_0315d09578 [Mucor ambiguus]